MPKFPTLGFIVAIFAVTFITLSTLKIIDDFKTRATVITEKVAVYIGPSKEDNQLFELFEGAEVLVLKFNGDWTQVSFAEGQSGWVPKQSLFLTSGSTLW